MNNAIKGKQGFQSKAKEDKLIKRVSSYLTEEEHKKFKEYVDKHNTTMPECIRSFIQRLY
tara:strand:+ start:569 stop:748 length:180 start_codon:yes stop_codon:yes gene_type:complete